MPYTVAYRDAGIKRHEYDTYVRLLRKRGVEWTEAQRVAEPRTRNRWIYVWEDEGDAQSFCDDIRKETHDDKWYVDPLDERTPISHGPLMPVVIRLTRQSHGFTFTLHPHSRSAIRRRFPDSHQASSLVIDYGTHTDFEQAYGPIWDHVAMALSGLSLEQLNQLGGYRVYDPATDTDVYDTSPEIVA